MSRFLKVIVNLVLVCALLSAAALLVPSFAGVDMNIIKSDRVETNLPVGSVVYGKTKPLAEVAVGDDVFVVESDGSEYLYKVNGVDADNGTVVLQNAKNAKEEASEKTAESLSVVYITVPFLGYLAVAAGTVKGWVIIGLAALLLLLLYILSEIWRKDKIQDEIEDDEDGTLEEEELTKAEKKRLKKEKKAAKKEARREAEEEDEEDDEYEAYLKKKEEKRASKRARKEARKEARQLAEAKTNTRAIEAEPEGKSSGPVQGSTVDLFEAARAEMASSVSSAMAEGQMSGENSALTADEISLNIEQALTKELAKAASDAVSERNGGAAVDAAPVEETTENSQEILMPVYTADELIRKAIMAGDEPEVREDKDLGLTLLDYSSLL